MLRAWPIMPASCARPARRAGPAYWSVMSGRPCFRKIEAARGGRAELVEVPERQQRAEMPMPGPGRIARVAAGQPLEDRVAARQRPRSGSRDDPARRPRWYRLRIHGHHHVIETAGDVVFLEPVTQGRLRDRRAAHQDRASAPASDSDASKVPLRMPRAQRRRRASSSRSSLTSTLARTMAPGSSNSPLSSPQAGAVRARSHIARARGSRFIGLHCCARAPPPGAQQRRHRAAFDHGLARLQPAQRLLPPGADVATRHAESHFDRTRGVRSPTAR